MKKVADILFSGLDAFMASFKLMVRGTQTDARLLWNRVSPLFSHQFWLNQAVEVRYYPFL